MQRGAPASAANELDAFTAGQPGRKRVYSCLPDEEEAQRRISRETAEIPQR